MAVPILPGQRVDETAFEAVHLLVRCHRAEELHERIAANPLDLLLTDGKCGARIIDLLVEAGRLGHVVEPIIATPQLVELFCGADPLLLDRGIKKAPDAVRQIEMAVVNKSALALSSLMGDASLLSPEQRAALGIIIKVSQQSLYLPISAGTSFIT